MAMMYLLLFEATSFLEGSLSSRDERDEVECSGRALVAYTRGTSVCISMGNVGREAWVSRDVVHWHVFLR